MRQLLHRSRRGVSVDAAPAGAEILAPPARVGPRPDPHKRHMNDLIEKIVPGVTASPFVGFVCECRTSECLQTVWLTADDYATNRAADSGWTVRAPGHEPV